MRNLLGLGDSTRSLLEMEASANEDTPELEALRANLTARYASYADNYGPENR